MYFQRLQARLVAMCNERVRNGAVTERGLARLTGISQSHVHQVLKGTNGLTPAMSDRILMALQWNALDLLCRELAVGDAVAEGVRPKEAAERVSYGGSMKGSQGGRRMAGAAAP